MERFDVDGDDDDGDGEMKCCAHARAKHKTRWNIDKVILGERSNNETTANIKWNELKENKYCPMNERKGEKTHSYTFMIHEQTVKQRSIDVRFAQVVQTAQCTHTHTHWRCGRIQKDMNEGEKKMRTTRYLVYEMHAHISIHSHISIQHETKRIFTINIKFIWQVTLGEWK